MKSTRFTRRPTRWRRHLDPTGTIEPFLPLDNLGRQHRYTDYDNEQGLIELSSSSAGYQPPPMSLVDFESNNHDCCLPGTPFYYPSSTSFSVNANPAIDLAANSLCSHGCCCVQCVRTQELGVLEDCGRFDRVVGPGLHVFCWPFSTVAGRMSLRVRQMDITCETKTADHVFVQVTMAILYRVLPSHIYEAYYGLQNPLQVIETGVLNVIRSTIPSLLTLDQVFSSEKTLSNAVRQNLQGVLREFGYELVTSLVTHISPSAKVQASMNEIEASRRWKQAAAHQADANKIGTIKKSEGRAERDARIGVGVAKARSVIAAGMRESLQIWTEVDVRVVKPPTPAQVMEVLLVSQYMDVLTHLGSDNVFVEYGAQVRSLLERAA